MVKILKTSADGRKCMFPHCTRILSVYNHNAYCHIHLDQMLQEQIQVVPLGDVHAEFALLGCQLVETDRLEEREDGSQPELSL